MEKTDKSGRLASLDALRGFDMLFIMGGEGLICAIAAVMGYPDFSRSFGHVPWHGLQFMDTVFPLFLFLAGVSFPFSAAKSRARGLTDGQIALKALRRGLTLVALGFVCSGLFKLEFATLRAWSVLGRIGLAWMFAAWLFLLFKTRARLAIAAGLLAAVTLFTVFVPAPGAAAGVDPFSAEGNFGCWLDRTLTAGHTYQKLFDPEGFAGLLPAVVTAMLGMFAGELVRRDDGAATGRKAAALLACGAGCALAGWALSFVFPVNKALWSPSFALVVGGYSFALFALFYWVVDVLGCRRWTYFFTVIGVNSITIYMAQRIVNFRGVRDFFFGGLAGLLPEAWGNVVLGLGYIAVCWLFLWFLHKKDVHLKV